MSDGVTATAVIANHSETLYSIITEATGIDTSDPVRFPKEDGSSTRVRNFNDLWIVKMDGSGTGRLIRHHVFWYRSPESK